MYCSNCSNQIPDDMLNCPYCNQVQNQNPQNFTSQIYITPVKKKEHPMGIGAIIWCSICLFSSAVLFMMSMVNIMINIFALETGDMTMLIITALAQLSGAIGLAILLCGRTEGFTFVLLASMVNVIVLVPMMGMNASSAIIEVANPLIIWFIIKPHLYKFNTPSENLKEQSMAFLFAALPFTGLLGIDRFYLGYVYTGLFKLFTFGGFFVLYIVDIMRIKNGKMKDKYGRSLT